VIIVAVIVLVAIIVLIDFIAIIVLIAFCRQISADLSIPGNIWIDKHAAIAKLLKIWEINSVLPCKLDVGELIVPDNE
jgi:hypothetical protein